LRLTLSRRTQAAWTRTILCSPTLLGTNLGLVSTAVLTVVVTIDLWRIRTWIYGSLSDNVCIFGERDKQVRKNELVRTCIANEGKYIHESRYHAWVQLLGGDTISLPGECNENRNGRALLFVVERPDGEQLKSF
jgi:hypothetical protein